MLMEPWYSSEHGDLYNGNCLDILRGLSDEMVNCCVTSPPYYGLRDYGLEPAEWPAMSYAPMAGLPEITVPAITCCLGLEETPEAFIGHMVLIFREVRRVLRKDGTLWLNLGDSYNASKGQRKVTDKAGPKQTSKRGSTGAPSLYIKDLKPKDLLGIPWRVAFALQADGWYLRQDIIWSKPNAMPESVRDRCTKAHEYVFLLSKSPKYYYDHEAVKEPAVKGASGSTFNACKTADHQLGRSSDKERVDNGKRNRRSVWHIATRPYKEAHFAVYPPDLITHCILAGCPEGSTVLDPFGGSGTTAEVAESLGRRWVQCEQSLEYCGLNVMRLIAGGTLTC